MKMMSCKGHKARRAAPVAVPAAPLRTCSCSVLGGFLYMCMCMV